MFVQKCIISTAVIACAIFAMACGGNVPAGEKPELVSLTPSPSSSASTSPKDAAPPLPSSDASVSETSSAICEALGTACKKESDTTCNHLAMCHCGLWMTLDTAKSFTCSGSSPDAGALDVSVEATAKGDAAPEISTGLSDSGSSETTSDAPADSGSDALVSVETSPGAIGKLAISVLLPRWGAMHPITVYAYEHWTGGAPSPGKWTATGRGIDFTVDAVAGSKFVWNGFYDPKTSTADDWTNAFCDWKFLTQKVAVWVTFNDKPTARVKVVPNLTGGCNLELIAAASPLISTSDKDGDGFSPSDPDPAMRDCDDDPATGHRRFPGQIETPEDDLDLDCDGWKDPPRAIIRMKGVSIGAAPILHDVLRWGTTHAMSWETTSSSYQTPPLELDLAPRVFFVNWADGGWDSSYEAGLCKELTGGILMYRDTDKTLIPMTLKPALTGTSCHRFAEIP